MKTPDEIKKGLECCTHNNCNDCPYRDKRVGCRPYRNEDALALIQQLEAELSDAKNNHQHTIDIAERQKAQIDKLKKVIVRLNAERDAFLHGLKCALGCRGCAHFDNDSPYESNECIDCSKLCNWVWEDMPEPPEESP